MSEIRRGRNLGTLVPIELAAHVRNTLPSAVIWWVNCGHVLQVERPAETHAAIAALLRQGGKMNWRLPPVHDGAGERDSR